MVSTLRPFTGNIDLLVAQNKGNPILVRYEEKLMPEMAKDKNAPPKTQAIVPISYVVYQYGHLNGKIHIEPGVTYLPISSFAQKVTHTHPKRTETEWELQKKRMRFIRGEAGVLYMPFDAIEAGRLDHYRRGAAYHRLSTLTILTGEEITKELNGNLAPARKALGLEK